MKIILIQLVKITLIILFYFEGFSQNTIYVDSSQIISGNGFSWQNAYSDLSIALDFAHKNPNVDSILVAKGTYIPKNKPYNMGSNMKGTEISISGNNFRLFHIRPGLYLFGGYPSGGGERNIELNSTILDGKRNETNNVYHVVLIDSSSLWTAENGKSIISGFTIRNGIAGLDNTATVNSNLISTASGGGIYINNGTVIIDGNKIVENNSILEGGGIYMGSGNAKIYQNEINNNFTDGNGGGIYVRYNSGNIKNNIISGNSARRGGGIYSFSNSNFIEDNVINNDSAFVEGGGFWGRGIIRKNRINYCYNGGVNIMNSILDSNIISNNTIKGGVQALIDNIIINNAIESNQSFVHGAGLDVQRFAQISKNKIINNIGQGINLRADQSYDIPFVVNENVIGNNSGTGLYIYSLHSIDSIYNNHILSNTSNNGAGIYIDMCLNCVFGQNKLEFNVANIQGSSIYSKAGTSRFTDFNCFSNNSNILISEIYVENGSNIIFEGANLVNH